MRKFFPQNPLHWILFLGLLIALLIQFVPPQKSEAAVYEALGERRADGQQPQTLHSNPNGLRYPLPGAPHWSAMLSLSSTQVAPSEIWIGTGRLISARKGHTATLLANGKVLVAGGSNGRDLSSAELYDPVTGLWSATGNLNRARSSHTATLLSNGKVLVVSSQSSELYDPATGLWSVTGNLNTAGSSNTATLLPNGKVLVVGGQSSELYDPATGLWSVTGNLSTARASHTATLLANGKVLVAGGFGNTSNLSSAELYDPATGLWSATGNLNTARASHTATLLANGKVLVAGGFGNRGFLNSAELYDPATGLWSTTGNLNDTLFSSTATLLPNGKVLVMGDAVLSRAELYDPATGLWNYTRSPLTPRDNHTATLLPDGRVLVVGGETDPGNGIEITDSAALYDSAMGLWSSASNLASARSSQAGTLLPDGRVLVAGGDNGNAAINNTELYTPTTGLWSGTGNLNTARYFHTVTLLANGKVLVAGGFNRTNADLNSAELYDPATGLWSTTGNLNTARRQHTATLLANGKVLVVGGTNGASSLTSAELYDPITGVWSVSGVLTTARTGHTATLLPNGTLLVAGGLGPSFIERSAELYDPASGIWRATGTLLNAYIYHTATLLPNGNVLVAGGGGASLGSQNNAELYDPATGLWSATGSLSNSRQSHTATLLPNGKVLAVGGLSDPGNNQLPLRSSELYDPVSGTWRSTGFLSLERISHTVTLLPNGKVLAIGGRLASSALSSVELYDVGLGFLPAWQPTLTSATSPLAPGAQLNVTGTQFQGVSEASGGSTQNSASNYPLVQLLSLVNEQSMFLPVDMTSGWSATSFTSTPLTQMTLNSAGFPRGHALVTVFANGIPSASRIIVLGQSPPTITPVSVTRQQGSAASNSIIANVSDSQDAAGSLSVTATSVPTGITVTNITNTNGTIRADMATTCTATLGNNNVVLTVTNSSRLTATATLVVNVTANTAPTLGTYADQTVAPGSNVTVTPNAAPADNGTVASLTAVASAGFTGSLATNLTTGAVTITNARPSGTYTITVTATDNCGLRLQRTFVLVVLRTDTATTVSSSLNPSTFGQFVTFTATVNPLVTGAGTPTGTVTFRDGSTTLATVALSANSAMFSTAALAAGVHSITAVYNGDSNFNPNVSAPLTQTVTANTATTLTSSLNPSTVGQSVTFTATVSSLVAGAGTPAGLISFLEQGVSLATVPLSNGVATFSTTLLPARTHVITAVYSGNSLFNASTSAPLTQVVKANTSSVVRASVNPSILQQSVSFTATVNSSVTGAGTPTGTVTFLDRNVVLGTSTLSGGLATLNTTTLSAGLHSITAVYNGDSNFNPSASAPLLQTVRPNLAPCGGANFSTVANYTVGANPYWIATGSFSGNGRYDLAIANRNGNTVSILPNGNGAFQAKVDFAAGTNPASVAVGDFNLDGRADLVVANENSGNVSLLLGLGNGQFQSAVNFGIGAGARAVVVSDFNRDGKLDLATANFNSNNLSVLLGNGNGTFQTAVNSPAGQNPISIAPGDYNGDGNADLAVANYGANTVAVYLGRGDGGFLTPTSTAVGTNPHSVAAGDFDSDGRLDLAVANYESHNVSVLRGTGNGTFQPAVQYAVGLRPVYVAVGDLNGDGNADLAVANYLSNNVSLMLGNAQGAFQSATNFNVGNAPRSLAVEDLDGDGTLDLAVGNEFSNTVSLLRNSCGQADLLFTHHVFPATAAVGQSATYTLRVTNTGPGAATSVTVTDTLPATTTFVSCEATNGGICGGSGNNRTVSLATLAAGDTTTITLTVNITGQLNDGDVITNTAAVTSAIPDPDLTNNTGTTMLKIQGFPQARLSIDSGRSGFDFAALIVRPEPPTSPPSDSFTIANAGNAPLLLNFTSILRVGMNVDGQRISNPDDRKFYSLRAINADGTETAIGIGTTRTIPAGQTQRFRVLYVPTRPPVADSTRNLPASLVLQESNSSILTITPNSGSPLTINLLGRVDPRAQLLPPVLFRRDGNDLVVEASVYDANLNTNVMRFQFLDSAGNPVETHDVSLAAVLAQSTIITGQSFVVEQRFPGLASKQNIANVKVTVLDADGSADTATSGAATQAIGALANVSAASYGEAGMASEAMASAFGAGLATTSLAAVSVPLPTNLAGTSVKIKDSLGAERLAPLFYVSPTQVNYLIPSGTAPGLALVTVMSGDGKVAMGATNIAWVAPALFSANSNGEGVAAAVVQRVAGNGAQSFESVASFDAAQKKFVAVPISLGDASDQVYLTLFGTGVRHNSTLAAVKAEIGGIAAPVVYAGAQGDYVGLDQINVLLPRNLIGRGEIEVKLLVDYQLTNTVKIHIK